MARRKVLFCIRDFNHGGIPKSLENLLTYIDKEKYDISLFCAYQEGYYKSVFSKYTILPPDRLLYWFCVNYRTLSGLNICIAMTIKIISKICLKLNVNLFDCYLKHVAKKIVSEKKYDVVVAFAEGWITDFVSCMDGVERKVAWIHMDYKRVLSYEKGIKNAEIYSKFDYIVSPCKFSAKSFEEIHPELSHKVISIRNVLDVEMIKKESKYLISNPIFPTNSFTIVSVGRICYEKQFYQIPSIVDKIRQKNDNFKWYIIGSGPEAEVAILREEIKKHKVEDFVILLGSKDNPYPYIANCNLVAILSLSETFSYVAYEAKILGVPIITTDFGAASEIVEENIGRIVSKEKYADELLHIMKDKEYYREMVDALRMYQYDNTKILSKIDKLLS